MHTKTSKVINIIVVSLLILTTSISIGFYFSQPQQSALANNEPVEQVPDEKSAQPVTEQDASQQVPVEVQETLLKTKNDIAVEITSTKVISTGVQIGICYTAPDNGEWRPMPGHLFYGQYDIYPDEIEFLEEEKLADGKNTGTRCALVRYRIEDLNTLVTPIEFSILKFYAPGREMYTPCQELQQRLDSNPKAKAYGLKANCVENSDGTISATLLDHAKSVSNDNAKQALDKIAKGEVDGPWEFTITEIEK